MEVAWEILDLSALIVIKLVILVRSAFSLHGQPPRKAHVAQTNSIGNPSNQTFSFSKAEFE